MLRGRSVMALRSPLLDIVKPLPLHLVSSGSAFARLSAVTFRLPRMTSVLAPNLTEALRRHGQ